MISRLSKALLSLLVVGLCGCAAPPKKVSPAPPSALLAGTREVTGRYGLPAAKDYVVEQLMETDESGGALERRVIRTTADGSLILPDSLAAMPLARRKRTALAIIPGTRAGNQNSRDRTRECLEGAAAQSRAMGFATHFLKTEARGTIEQNADLVASQMRDIFAGSDAVIILMLSKGAHDVIHYLQHGGAELPAAHRGKLVAVISLAGTVQGSVVAEWLVTSRRPLAAATRTWLSVSGQDDAITMLQSIGETPWVPERAVEMGGLYPQLTWVSIAMVPDGTDGRISEKLWSPYLRRRIEETAPAYSPSDGLV